MTLILINLFVIWYISETFHKSLGDNNECYIKKDSISNLNSCADFSKKQEKLKKKSPWEKSKQYVKAKHQL